MSDLGRATGRICSRVGILKWLSSRDRARLVGIDILSRGMILACKAGGLSR